MNKTVLIIIFLVVAQNSFAQTTENKAWFFLSHTQEVSKKGNVLADVQVRSSTKVKRVETRCYETVYLIISMMNIPSH
jgi:hypothetical protein